MIKKHLPQSNYRHGKQSIKRIGIHDTGNINGDGVQGNYNYFNNNDRSKNGITAHYFVDDIDIYEFIEPEQKCWHVGGKFNADSIGIENCNMTTKEKFLKQMDIVTKFCAEVLLKYNLKCTTSTIVGHYEANQNIYEKWDTGSKHTDPKVYFTRYGWTMDIFREAVQKKINEIKEIEMVHTTTESIKNKYGSDGESRIKGMISRGSIKGDEKGNISIPDSAAFALIVMDREKDHK